MNASTQSANLCGGRQSRQSGVIVFMALIILVAMSLAGVALVRSINAGNWVIGALTARHTSDEVADYGLNAALKNFMPGGVFGAGAFGNSQGDNTAYAYVSYYNSGNSSSTGIPSVFTNGTYDSTYPGLKTVIAGGGGLTYRYYIERLCDYTQDGATGTYFYCITHSASEPWTQSQNNSNSAPPAVPLFRLTVRVDTESSSLTTGNTTFSPHNATSYSQMTIIP